MEPEEPDPDRPHGRGDGRDEELPQHPPHARARGGRHRRRRRDRRRRSGHFGERARGAEGEARLMDARTILIRPVISEKSYALIAEGKYTFRVDERAHKTQIAQAVEEVFGVGVTAVRTSKVNSKPKRRGLTRGRTRSWKKAVVQVAPGERIELFEGAETA